MLQKTYKRPIFISVKEEDEDLPSKAKAAPKKTSAKPKVKPKTPVVEESPKITWDNLRSILDDAVQSEVLSRYSYVVSENVSSIAILRKDISQQACIYYKPTLHSTGYVDMIDSRYLGLLYDENKDLWAFTIANR